MPKTLFWLRCVHSTWQQMLHIRLLRNHLWRFSICRTVVPRLVYRRRRKCVTYL